MFIINFSFFLIILKIFFLTLLNLNNYIYYKLKNYFIYYFIYDIIISILIITINFLYIKNTIIQKLLLNLSIIALILQSYIFLYIVYFMIKKQKKIDILYKKIFYINMLFIITKIITFILYYKIETIENYNYYIILPINILFYTLFQYNIQSECLIDLYLYIKNYKINSSLKKSYKIFFYTFITKNILYDFLLIFFDVLNSINNNIIYFKINYLYQILYIMPFISLLNYFSIFFIIVTAKKAINKSFDINNNLNYDIKFTEKDIYKITSNHTFFYDFLLLIIKKNINSKLKITDSMSVIIYKNHFYKELFNENNIIYKEILKNKIISYDHYYNIYNAYILIKNNFNFSELELYIKEIISELEKYNIRLISPFYIKNQLIGYLVINQNSFNIKKQLTTSDLSNLYNLSNYIDFCYEKLTNNLLYTQLNYQKKISEQNLIENNYKYDEIYKKLNEKIPEINQIFIYENHKKIYKIFNNTENIEIVNFISNIHKNDTLIDSNKIQPKYFFLENQNTSCAILCSGKITLHKHYASFYTIIPFIRNEYGLLYNLYYHNRIDTIFPYYDKYLNNDKSFFSCYDNNFNIKIIIIAEQANSFFKIINYFSNIVQFQCIYISCKNLNKNNFQKIFDYYNYILEDNKKYYIFFTYIEAKSYIYQKYILDKYIEYIFKSKDIFIKLFFIINNEDELKNINQEIIQIAKCLTIKTTNQKEIKHEILEIIIKNYTNKILNKEFSIEIIKEFINNNFNDKFNNIYSFIDLFEQNIIIEEQKNIKHTNEFYIEEAIRLKRESLKNTVLMNELLKKYNNYTIIAKLIGVHKSTISRYFKT